MAKIVGGWQQKMAKDIAELEDNLKNFNIYFGGKLSIPQIRHKKMLEQVLANWKETLANPIQPYPFLGANSLECDNPNGPCYCGAWHSEEKWS